MSDGTIRHCGSGAPHTPHPNPDDGSACPGIMPTWPCGRPVEHHDHDVGGHYWCPGTLSPPPNTTGPWYPESLAQAIGDWRLPHAYLNDGSGFCNRLDAVKGGGPGRRCGLPWTAAIHGHHPETAPP
jgi:hypothetical protein